MTAPSVERRPDHTLSPVQRVWLELADAQQRGQKVRLSVLSAALRGLAKGGLVCLLLGLVLAVAVPATPSAAALQSSASRTITAKVDRYESWPDLATARDRSLILVHSSGDRHVATRRACVVRRSTDNGGRWSTVKVFRSTTGPRLWACEALVRLADGSLILVVSRLRGHDDIDYVQFWRSTTNGRTWAKVGTDRDWETPVTFGNLTQLRDGSLIMPWHGAGKWGMVYCDPTAVKCSLRAIDNNGPTAAEGRIFEVTQSGDRLVMLGRSRTRGLLRFTSPNGGHYWTRGIETGLGIKTEGGAASQDRLTLMLADRTTGKVHVRVSSLEQVYSDHRAWGPARYLFTMPGRIAADRGYPAVVHTGVGRLAYALYAGDYTPSIRTGRLS